ncbi:hypothetical protein AB0D86_40880 [Streptomyces sp. NPDC048324]|uniref:hypothetical protein n=1 Tax=Streptomyces sp. NPDC048324 TaxID=3157205 RepID=UPI003422F83C
MRVTAREGGSGPEPRQAPHGCTAALGAPIPTVARSKGAYVSAPAQLHRRRPGLLAAPRKERARIRSEKGIRRGGSPRPAAA